MAKRARLLQGITTVGERGQIVIPRDIRTALKLKAGDTMIVLERCGKLIVFPTKHVEEFYRSVLDDMERVRKLKP